MTKTIASLRELREKVLRYRIESVARLSRLDIERLREIEDGGDGPSVYELEVLADLYGIDAEQLADMPIHLDRDQAIEALACLDEFIELGDSTRARIIAASNAARDVRRLQAINSVRPEPLPRILEKDMPDRNAPAYKQGAVFATYVRSLLDCGTAPIESLRDLVSQIPGILVLYANLTEDGPAGLTFSDASRGTTIVINMQGKNINPAVRRFSLAHELCHALLDTHHKTKLAVLSGYLNEQALSIEQRANAFAVRLMCPETELKKLRLEEPNDAIARLLESYGLHYGAARLYLRNEANVVDLPQLSPPAFGAVGTSARLERAEAPNGIESFPLVDVPPERRTLVAMYAARAYADGKITRDGFANYLAITPAHEVECVADFFGMTPPNDQLVA